MAGIFSLYAGFHAHYRLIDLQIHTSEASTMKRPFLSSGKGALFIRARVGTQTRLCKRAVCVLPLTANSFMHQLW